LNEIPKRIGRDHIVPSFRIVDEVNGTRIVSVPGGNGKTKSHQVSLMLILK